MNTRSHFDRTAKHAVPSFSLTPEFTTVLRRLCEQKPFKRLPLPRCANTRLKPGVNEK